MSESVTSPRALVRNLATSLAGSAAFGISSGVGYGPSTMGQGAWMAPALFVGGAALALPPLYMFGTLLGGQSSLSQIVGRLSGALASVSLALLGLAAPAAYLSVTLRTALGPLLLVLASIIVGAAGVVAVLRESLDAEPDPRPRAALLGWGAFALALGGRLLWSIARTRGL